MLPSIHHSDYQRLRERLKSVRLKAGVTQVQMAEALGVGQSFVSKVERGQCCVDFFLYLQWCKVCRVSASRSLNRLMDMLD